MSPTLDARRQVLFATDLQARSRALLDAARAYAEATDAGVTLIHCVDPAAWKGASRGLRRGLMDQAHEEARQALAAQVAELAEAGVAVDEPILTVDQPAHRAILHAVEATGAEIVLVGSQARPGKGYRLGSTADRLLRSSPVPVLVLRGTPRIPFPSVAFLTDFSARSRRAHLAGARLLPIPGTAEGARIAFLHAGDETLRRLDPSHEGRTVTHTAREARELAEALGAGAPQCRPRLVWGMHPGDALLSAISDDGYDVVVLGTHGHGPLRRALIGSIAMGLAQSAPCSVLVVPGT